MKRLITISGFIGITLLAINIAGFFIPLKNPAIYQEQKTGFVNDTTLTYEEALKLLDTTPSQDTKEYVQNVNKIINQSIAHYWEDEGISKYRLTIPPYENYVLFSLRFIFPSIYEKYEYCSYDKALKRGVGLCSQHAIVITDFLNKKGLETRIVGLDGHVVATVKVDKDEWWILDPDFGVVIPYNLQKIESSPELVKSYYAKVAYKNKPIYPETLENIYEARGNIIYPVGVSGYTDCNWKKVIIERSSYILKWLIPILLTTPLVYSMIRKRHAR